MPEEKKNRLPGPDEVLKGLPSPGDILGEEVKKKEPTSEPLVSNSPLVSADTESSSTLGGSVPSGINYLQGTNFESPAPLEIPQSDPDLLTAATTPVETTAKDQAQFSPEIQKTGLLLGDKSEALLRGVAKGGSYLLQSPSFIYDAGITALNKVVNKPFGLPDAPTFGQLGNDNGLYKGAINDLEGAIGHSAEKQNEKFDQEIHQYLFGEKKDVKKGLDLLFNKAIESVPVSLAIMVGAATNPVGTSAVGASAFAADKKREIDKLAPDMPEEQKVGWAALSGGTEMALENMGLTKLVPLFKNTLKSAGKKALETQTKEVFDRTVGKIAKQYLGIHAEEIGSEMANTFIQNVYDVVSGVNPDKGLMDGVWDSGLVAGLSSTGMTTPTFLADVAITKKMRKEAQEIKDQKTSLQVDLQSPDVSDEAKKVISDKFKSLNEKEADLYAEQKEKTQALSPEGKEELSNLIQESKKIVDAASDETLTEDTREILKKDLDEVDKKIDKVYETAKAEKPAEKPVEQAQDTSVQDEIDYLNEIKNSGIPMDETESARLTELTYPAKPVEASEQIVQPTAEKQVEEINPPQNVENKDQGQKAQEASDVLTPESTEQVNEPAPVEKPKPAKELIDEEDVAPDNKDDAGVVEKMNTDIEAMKQMKTEDLAEKKFVGMIERAWKAKDEGKISRPTYTEFRNKAKDILEGKVKAKDSVDATEAKLRSTAALNKVKERLIGQNYKKITLSTSIPVTPQNISDLIDLTNKLIHRGIDAGFTISEATAKALKLVKNHPTYKKLVASKEVDEKEFEKTIKGAIKEDAEKPAAKKPVKKEPKKEDDGIEGETRKKKTAARQETSPEFKDTVAEMSEDDKFYKSIKKSAVEPHINKILDKVQQDGELEQMAEAMLAGENPFHIKIAQVAQYLLAERLNIVAQNDGNQMQKSATHKLAAKLLVQRNERINVSATQIALEDIIAQRLPLSEEGLKAYAEVSYSKIQDRAHTDIQKKDIKQAAQEYRNELDESFNNLVREAVKSEINRIVESTKGKEWADKIRMKNENLRIDLKEC